jgi:metallo-beta-lactamase class B
VNTKFYLFLAIIFLNLYDPSNAQELKKYIINSNIEYIPVNIHACILISYADLPGIGRTGTNHLLYIKNNKAFLFDTPNDNAVAGELFQWVKDSLHVQITAVSVHHWHRDHSGGLDTLHKLGVTSYSYYKTKEYMEMVGLPPAQTTFPDSLLINFEGTKILLAFMGAGHTKDNSVGWIESERILFPGGNIRCINNSNVGYIKDADLVAWPMSVENIRKRFCNVGLIIPGHGVVGGAELFEHTARLLSMGK